MKTKDAIEIFGSIKEVAHALGLTVQAIYAWGEDVPLLRAYQLQELIERTARASNHDQDIHQCKEVA